MDKVPSAWTKKGNMTAEMWVFYCKELRPSLLFPTKKQYPIKDDYALDPKECRLDEWNVISSQQDADTLTNIALGFFDLAIEMVVKKEGKTTVCLGSRGEYGIKIRFEGVERMFGIDEIGIILDADIIYNPGSCGLFINEGVPREGGIPVTENDYFITADKVSYQLILN